MEEENLKRTYETFLNECKYLEECKFYHQKSLQFSKKINGKTLKDFLLINESICYSNASIQTDLVEYEIKKIQHEDEERMSISTINDSRIIYNHNDNSVSNKKEDKKPKITISESNNNSNSTLRKLLFETESFDNNLNNSKKTTVNGRIPSFAEANRKKSSRKNTTMISKRKSNLILTTPTKNQTHNYDLFAEQQTNTYESFTSANDNYINSNNNFNIEQDLNHDIDAFIESLCKNDFAQKLAQSINEMNIKKLGNTSLDDGSKNISNLSLIINNVNNTNNMQMDGVTTNTQNMANNNEINSIQEQQNLIEPKNINEIGNSSILENNLDNLDFDLLVKPSSSQQQIMETLPQFMPSSNYQNNDYDLNSNVNKIISRLNQRII